MKDERPSEASKIRASEQHAVASAWREALGPVVGEGEASKLMGITPAQLAQKIAGGELVVLTDSGAHRVFPVAQFHDGQPIKTLVAAHRLLVEHGHLESWTAMSWCLTPHPELHAHSPREWLITGRDGAAVIEVARHDAARLAQ